MHDLWMRVNDQIDNNNEMKWNEMLQYFIQYLWANHAS